VLARDVLGVKPLFWCRGLDGRVGFGTDVKSATAIVSARLELNWKAALQQVSGLAGPVGNCWADVREVEPGSAVVIQPDGHVQVRRWHRWSYSARPQPLEAVVAAYEQAVVSSIRTQVGHGGDCALALSGGVDSALICGVAGGEVPAYVVANGSTRTSGDLEAAREVAKASGVELREIMPGPSSRRYLDVLRFSESPLVGTEHLLKDAIAAAVSADDRTVLLTGQGSDEFNGGYSRALASKGENFARYLETASNDHVSRICWSKGVSPDIAPFLKPNFLGLEDTDDLWERELHRRVTRLNGYNLWLEDRLAARHGVESRVPFLGESVLGVVWSVPRELQEALLWDKFILRSWAGKYVPSMVARRPKQPFYHGRGASAAYRVLTTSLFEGDEGPSPVQMARDSTAVSGDGPLSAAAFDSLTAAVKARPWHEGVEALARMVNLALLGEQTFMRESATEVCASEIRWVSD
jgi:asparagine synthase (glutamine-hydrolysing)